MPKVLLTYGWVRSTYAALRNLVSHDLNVIVTDSNRIGMCQFSRLPTKKYIYPSPTKDPNKFIQYLYDISKKENIDMLIPSHDETEILALHRNKFEPKILLPIPSYNQIKIANDKSTMEQLARKLSIPVAERVHGDTLNEILDELSKYPESTKFVVRFRRSNSSKGVRYATSVTSTKSILNQLCNEYSLPPNRIPIVQKYVNGEGWGVSCLYWHGEPICHFTHRRLREKIETGGPSTLREHQPNPLLENLALKLLSSLKWHGLAMVEFKFNAISNQGWFIEINPRLWGSIHLAISAGVEFPYLLYLAATRGPNAAKEYHSKQKLKYPWKSRWYLGDCILAASKFSKMQLLSGIKCTIPSGTNTYDDILIDDPFVFLGEILYYGSKFIRFKNINPIEPGMIG